MHSHTTTVLSYRLPKGSEILVSHDQNVSEGEALARTFVSKETLNFSLPSYKLIKNPGEDIKKGDLVAVKKGFLGLFSKKFLSPIDGKIDRVDVSTGEVFIKLDPSEVPFVSDVSGRVVEVEEDLVSVEFKAIELDAVTTYKGKKVGKLLTLKVLKDTELLDSLDDKVEDAIIAVDSKIGQDFLFKASALGVKALIVSEDNGELIDSVNFEKKLKVLSKEVIISMPIFMLPGENDRIKDSIWEELEAQRDKSVILEGDSQKIWLSKQ